MIRFILLALLLLLIARAFWKVVDSVMEGAGATRRGGGRRTAPAVRLVRDPVCGTHVPSGSSLSLSAGGTTHYFCSEECRSEYRKRA